MSALGAVNSISSKLRGGLKPRAAKVYIVPLDIHDKDKPLVGRSKGQANETRSFQYFPESISDTRATNYQTKVIPGLSHPLYQWTSSGAREITFQAVFSRDRSLTANERSAATTLNKNSSEANRRFFSNSTVDQLAKATNKGLGLDETPLTETSGFLSRADQPRDVYIPAAIAWLRAFTYPEYSQDGKGLKSSRAARPFPPRKLILGLPGMRINFGESTLPPDEMYAIMTQCDVVYEGFFPDGTPRLARVDLAFAEIVQIGGKILSHDAFVRRRQGLNGYLLRETNLRGG
jgi:hypothetical protein